MVIIDSSEKFDNLVNYINRVEEKRIIESPVQETFIRMSRSMGLPDSYVLRGKMNCTLFVSDVLFLGLRIPLNRINEISSDRLSVNYIFKDCKFFHDEVEVRHPILFINNWVRFINCEFPVTTVHINLGSLGYEGTSYVRFDNCPMEETSVEATGRLNFLHFNDSIFKEFTLTNGTGGYSPEIICKNSCFNNFTFTGAGGVYQETSRVLNNSLLLVDSHIEEFDIMSSTRVRFYGLRKDGSTLQSLMSDQVSKINLHGEIYDSDLSGLSFDKISIYFILHISDCNVENMSLEKAIKECKNKAPSAIKFFDCKGIPKIKYDHSKDILEDFTETVSHRIGISHPGSGKVLRKRFNTQAPRQTEFEPPWTSVCLVMDRCYEDFR